MDTETAEEIVERITNAIKGKPFIKLPDWAFFAYHIAYKNRFGNSEPKEDVCNFIDYILKNKNITYSISKDTSVFRARKIMRSEIIKNDDGTFSGFDEEKSGVPPLRKTPNGRANTAGIPILYTATEQGTACAEIRPMKNDYISVAEYKVKEDIIVADFTLEQISKFDNIEAMFLKEMFRSFSLPVSNDLIDYLPSQFIAEYIKLKHENIAGIRYSSLHNIGGYNVAIFNKNKCDFIKSDVIECSKVTYEYTGI